jgi:hypothetical protein
MLGMAMSLGRLAASEAASERQLRLPLPPDPDFVPMATFPNGDWIGRVHTARGVERAYAMVRPDGHREAKVRDLTGIIGTAPVWIFVYVRDGRPLSVLQLWPSYQARDGELSGFRWHHMDKAELITYPQTLATGQDAQLRGAWLWWIYEVMNPEELPLEDRWLGTAHLPVLSALHMPVLIQDWVIPRVKKWTEWADLTRMQAQGYDPYRISGPAVQLIRLLQDEEALDRSGWGLHHGYWKALTRGAEIRLLRQATRQASPLGTQFSLKWTYNRWTLTMGDRVIENSDLLDLLLEAEFLLPGGQFEDWLDARIVEGRLLYNPEPFRLLDEPEPPMMSPQKFNAWLGGAA